MYLAPSSTLSFPPLPASKDSVSLKVLGVNEAVVSRGRSLPEPESLQLVFRLRPVLDLFPFFTDPHRLLRMITLQIDYCQPFFLKFTPQYEKVDTSLLSPSDKVMKSCSLQCRFPLERSCDCVPLCGGSGFLQRVSFLTLSRQV